MRNLLAQVEAGNFEAWVWLQRYKLYHILGTRFACWWLKTFYGWDETKELKG